MSLYEDVELIEKAISNVLYGDEEYDQDALNNLLQVKQDTIERGLETLCKIRARKISELNGLNAEIKRLEYKAESEEKAINRLNDYILSMFKRLGQKKVNAGTFTLGTRTSSSVYVNPDFNIEEFMRTKITTEPDKIAIRDALKAGRVIDGAYLVEKENLSIR